VPSSDEESEDDEEKEKKAMDAFYLRHQNRALASELRQYKWEIDQLERERDHRRISCKIARERVDALGQAWREMEAGLAAAMAQRWKPNELDLCHLTKIEPNEQMDSEKYQIPISDGTPGSTGTSEEVETVTALLNSLSRLAESPTMVTSKSENNERRPDSVASLEISEGLVQTDGGKSASLEDLETMTKGADLLSQRAESLKTSTLELLRRVLDGWSNAKETDFLGNTTQLHSRISSLENRCSELASKSGELAKARDDAAAGEKRVRRGLYRLASGRMKITDVLEVVEKEDSGMTLIEEFGTEDSPPEATKLSSRASLGGGAPFEKAKSVGDVEGANGGEGEQIISQEMLQLKKRIQDLDEVASAREMRIGELISDRDSHLKRINELVLSSVEEHLSEPSIADNDVKQSTIFVELSSKLATAERRIVDLKVELDDTRKEWAQSKGDLKLLHKTMEGMEKKHEHRLKELVTVGTVTTNDRNAEIKDMACEKKSGCNGSNDSATEAKFNGKGERGSSQYLSDAMQIIELEHRLKQALESVRQAETVRISLNEANMMTECLQSKLEELKVKNATLVADKAAARQSLETSSASSISHTSPHKYKDDRVNSSSSVERLHREHRKMRKELAAAVASKDSAKAKQDRAEKDRDSLMKTNQRLLKQSAEKDEMNAKSLSTILHLNQLSEQLNQEIDILEKRIKAAEQVSLAARLAANANERVYEEVFREKECIEKQLKKMKENVDSVLTEKDGLDSRLSQTKAQMVSVVKDIGTVRQRCNELTSESTSSAHEKTKMMELVAVAKKEAVVAAKMAAAATSAANMNVLVSPTSGRSKGVIPKSEFTMEQIETQVKVLKSRLACNVCNERDKQVILMRCRHMFCRQCVDKNIKNRSRKCPGCGQRFDMKDVGDVWL